MIDNFNPTIIDAPRPYYDNDPLPTFDYASDLGGYLYDHFHNIEAYDNIQFRRSPYKRGYPCSMFKDDDGNDITVYFDWERNIVWWWCQDNVIIHPKNSSESGAAQWFMTGFVNWNSAYCSYLDLSNWYIDGEFTDAEFEYEIGESNLTYADVTDVDGDFGIGTSLPEGVKTLHFTGGNVGFKTSESSIDLSNMDNSQANSFGVGVTLDSDIDDAYINVSGTTGKMDIDVDSDNNDLVVHYDCTDLDVADWRFTQHKCDINITNMGFTNTTSLSFMFSHSDIVNFVDNTSGEHAGIGNITDISTVFWFTNNIDAEVVTSILTGANSITNARQIFESANISLDAMVAFSETIDGTNINYDNAFANCTLDESPSAGNIVFPSPGNMTQMFWNTKVANSNTIDFSGLNSWENEFKGNLANCRFTQMFAHSNDITVVYPDWHGTFDQYGTFTPSTDITSISCEYTQSSPLYPDSTIADIKASGTFVITGMDFFERTYSVDVADCTITPDAPYSVGTQTFTLTYNGCSTTFTATISNNT